MRALVLQSSLAVVLAFSASSHAQVAAAGNMAAARADGFLGYRRLYDGARLCYVANGNVYAAFKRAGDAPNMNLFDKRAHQAYDLAFFNGEKMGLGREEILADIQTTTDAKLPRLVKERGYLTTVAKNCKRLGLM